MVLPILFSSGYAHSLMGLMGIMVIFSLAYNMMLGQGGMLSFGHAVYLAWPGFFTIHLLQMMDRRRRRLFPHKLAAVVWRRRGAFFRHCDRVCLDPPGGHHFCHDFFRLCGNDDGSGVHSDLIF